MCVLNYFEQSFDASFVTEILDVVLLDGLVLLEVFLARDYCSSERLSVFHAGNPSGVIGIGRKSWSGYYFLSMSSISYWMRSILIRSCLV